MLSTIYSVAKEFEKEHGFSPNCLYMNYGHLEALKQQSQEKAQKPEKTNAKGPLDFNRINKPLDAANTGAEGSSSTDRETPKDGGEDQ